MSTFEQVYRTNLFSVTVSSVVGYVFYRSEKLDIVEYLVIGGRGREMSDGEISMMFGSWMRGNIAVLEEFLAGGVGKRVVRRAS